MLRSKSTGSRHADFGKRLNPVISRTISASRFCSGDALVSDIDSKALKLIDRNSDRDSVEANGGIMLVDGGDDSEISKTKIVAELWIFRQGVVTPVFEKQKEECLDFNRSGAGGDPTELRKPCILFDQKKKEGKKQMKRRSCTKNILVVDMLWVKEWALLLGHTRFLYVSNIGVLHEDSFILISCLSKFLDQFLVSLFPSFVTNFAIEGLDQQLSCLAKDVGDLKREEEAILEQRSRSNLGGHLMHNNQWAYGNFSPHARTYEHNSYDFYEGNRFGARNGHNNKSYKSVPRNEVRNKGNVERYHDSYDHYEHNYGSKNMYNEHNDSYSYGKYN
ncbi:hypothetical protein M9H77_17578 [Catharanthus roseus]|uniref:Uncharacterized protein n=1 Tax=Catharanthus roseus TaxID=4058 RepID=A0ACC0B511_CATRO|nr:hypothetical protein M9H77_17578 [Catharanthus roseus]